MDGVLEPNKSALSYMGRLSNLKAPFVLGAR
jgi:hypothetical protein